MLLVSRLPLKDTQLLLLSGDGVLCCQGGCDCCEPCERQLLRRAHIDTAELAVGAPVPASALVPRLLATCRERADLAAESEGGCGAQPGIPGWGIYGEPVVLPIPLVDQGIILHNRHDL